MSALSLSLTIFYNESVSINSIPAAPNSRGLWNVFLSKDESYNRAESNGFGTHIHLLWRPFYQYSHLWEDYALQMLYSICTTILNLIQDCLFINMFHQFHLSAFELCNSRTNFRSLFTFMFILLSKNIISRL